MKNFTRARLYTNGLLLAAVVLASAAATCSTPPPVIPSHPPVFTLPPSASDRPFNIHTCIPNAVVEMNAPQFPPLTPPFIEPGNGLVTLTDAKGDAGFPNIPGDLPSGFNLHARAVGYQTYDVYVPQPTPGGHDYHVDGCGTPLNDFPRQVLLPAWPALLPAPPTYEAAVSMNLQFQGLVVHTQQFGDLPWFDAALSWLTTADQISVLQQLKAAGNTHVIIQLPTGLPLYDEGGQPYNPGNFPALDWTAGETKVDGRLADLVVRVRRAGLIPYVFPDERQDHSLKDQLLVVDALTHSVYGDIHMQVGVYMTGWDGVFYGWSPDQIQAWAAAMRAACADCRLGIEHNQGHIPLGEGPGDYSPTGRMKHFAVVLGEYDNWLPGGVAGDQVWQILGRMVRPYNRPADQPSGDDPNPPFYMNLPNALGQPFAYCAFEFHEYPWVRVDMTNPAAIAAMQADIARERAYLRALGARCTG